jgi:hypothetical protein
MSSSAQRNILDKIVFSASTRPHRLNSHLLDDLVREGSSINDVTRHDLLVAVPGREEERQRGVDAWVMDPR